MRQKLLATVARAGIIIAVTMGLVGIAHPAWAKRKIQLEGLKVEGRLQRPQAFYILQRSNLRFEDLQLKKSFIPKIIKSVERHPF